MERETKLSVWALLAILTLAYTLLVCFRDYPTGFMGNMVLPTESNLFSYINEAEDRASAKEDLNRAGNNEFSMYDVSSKAWYPQLSYKKDLSQFLGSLFLALFFIIMFFSSMKKKELNTSNIATNNNSANKMVSENKFENNELSISEKMKKYDITEKDRVYYYYGYKYSKLIDAINYAELQEKKSKS